MQVSEHQVYSDSLQECTDTLTSLRERLAACGQAAGDRYAIQNTLEHLQELEYQVRRIGTSIHTLSDKYTGKKTGILTGATVPETYMVLHALEHSQYQRYHRYIFIYTDMHEQEMQVIV